MTGAEQVAEILAEHGIRHAFGIIGGGNVVLWDAIHKLGKTEIISCHHEQAAAMAATYYWRTCKRLAICLVTTGAGSANAITGVVAAHMDSIPLVVISGNEGSKYIGDKRRVWGVQGYDSAKVVQPITNAALRIGSIELVEMAIEKAIVSATSYRMGAVWVDFPKDLQSAVAQ